jgi:hypothetical protein
MVLVCAWCSRFLGMKEPLERVELSHGICHICSVRLNWVDEEGLTRRGIPTLVVGKSRKDLVPLLKDLLRAVPEIRITIDRRERERRGQTPSGSFPVSRTGDRRKGVSLLVV